MMQVDPNERRIVHEEIVQTPQGADARVVEQRVQVVPTPAEVQVARLLRATQIVWFIVGVVIALILLRFTFLLLGANMDIGFGGLILTITQPLVAPFLPLFGEQHARSEFADLIAVAVYLLLGWGSTKLLAITMLPRTPAARF
jgi:hypothetical protein